MIQREQRCEEKKCLSTRSIFPCNKPWVLSELEAEGLSPYSQERFIVNIGGENQRELESYVIDRYN